MWKYVCRSVGMSVYVYVDQFSSKWRKFCEMGSLDFSMKMQLRGVAIFFPLQNRFVVPTNALVLM